METMTPKERIDAVIKHQAVDRTPFTVVDGGAWIAKTEGVTYRELYSRPDSGASSVVDLPSSESFRYSLRWYRFPNLYTLLP